MSHILSKTLPERIQFYGTSTSNPKIYFIALITVFNVNLFTIFSTVIKFSREFDRKIRKTLHVKIGVLYAARKKRRNNMNFDLESEFFTVTYAEPAKD